MSQLAPWTVRHLYTTADPTFSRYLSRMHSLLSQSEEAEWIDQRFDCPVADASETLAALSSITPGELVIVDLHGWADGSGARLSTTADGPDAMHLSQLPSGSWPAGAVILNNCRGLRSEFLDELGRLATGPLAVAGHFDEAWTLDFTPVALVEAVLRESDGGDDGAAFTALDCALYNRERLRDQGWGADRIKP